MLLCGYSELKQKLFTYLWPTTYMYVYATQKKDVSKD
jgi:hypothetical protein